MTITKKPFVFMAAALFENGGIGYKNGLPWNIPGDLEYYENVTTKSYSDQQCIYKNANEWCNVVIIGRHTYESSPMLCEPLANRFNIIVSRNPDFNLKKSPIAELATSLDQAFEKANTLVKDDGLVFLLGGETIYRQSILLPQCTHVLITNIFSAAPVPCDTFIPEIDRAVFRLASHDELESFLKENVPKGKQQFEDFEYEFVLYLRR